MAWALRDAPLIDPLTGRELPHLLGVLIGLANHANHEGRGAYPSQATLARYARKDERAVRNDMQRLVEIGLIRRGNQEFVAHIPADRRPVVYDLAIHRKRGEAQFPPEAGFPPEVQRRARGSTRPLAGGSTVPPNRPFEPSMNHPPNPREAGGPAPPGPRGEPPGGTMPQIPTHGDDLRRCEHGLVSCRACGTTPRQRQRQTEQEREATRTPCRQHRGEWADTCGRCRADTLAADDPDDIGEHLDAATARCLARKAVRRSA
jgi:hypothetical protein